MSDGQMVGVVLLLAMVALCVYEFWTAPLAPDEPSLSCMSCVDAAAAVLVDELMPEIEEALS